MKSVIGVCALASIAFILAGCENSTSLPVLAVPATQTTEHHHDGWWCNEHGVPEEVCALCNTTLVAEFKAKGDWCKEHDLPDSQCFVCHPDLEKAFAAQYEAKFGKKPPKPESDPQS